MRGASRPINVAIVGASLRILGGHAVQAQRLLDGWRDDSPVTAWLVPIDPVPPRFLRSLAAIKYVRTILTQLCYWPLLFRELKRADVVHIFSASYTSFLLAPLPAIAIAKLLNRPVLVNYHSGEAADHLARSPLARHVLRNWVDLNVVPSVFLRDVFLSFGIHAMVVPNTVDLTAFAYQVRDPIRPRLLSTRNFERVYNVACTLRAFALVQERFPDASMVLVGSGSQEPELRSLARELGLRNVTFAGRVEPKSIPGFYADADVYLQTPDVDNMPLSVLEAFASGLPVVSTNVGGVPAMLRDGVHGLMAPAGDPGAVAGRVVRLIEQPAFARQLAVEARETCTTYSWPIARDGWLGAYEATLKRASRAKDSSTAVDLAHQPAGPKSPAAERTETA